MNTLEYKVGDEIYIVERPVELAAEFGFDENGLEDQAVELHEALSQPQYVRQWMYVRRIFGIRPMLCLNISEHPTLTRRAMCEQEGISPQQLKAELELARAIVDKKVPSQVEAPQEITRLPEIEKRTLSREQALLKHGFDNAMFEVEDRPASENERERRKFADRVIEFDDLLEQEFTSEVARQVLITELQMKRNEIPLLQMKPTNKIRKDLQTEQEKLQKRYEDSLSKLDELSPWRAKTKGKQSGRASIFSLVEALRAYHSTGDRELIDGIFTAAEIEIQMRTSVQNPVASYRLGLTTYLLHAKEGLLNQKWMPQMRHSTIARLDKVFQKLEVEAREELGEPLPDLETSGKDGEHPDFPVPKPLPDAPVII